MLNSNNKIKDYLPEFVYGGMDGSITTFAVVAGATGANLSPGIVIVLGLANLIADGFSMSVGNYLSAKSELHKYEKLKSEEFHEVAHNPDEGRQEIREIYMQKGITGRLLEEVVAIITSNKEVWVDTMMKEELLMIKSSRRPLSTAIATFVSFNLLGFIPLLIYFVSRSVDIEYGRLFMISSVLTGASFILIGWLKSYVNEKSILRGITETLILGIIAATLAYFVGNVMEAWLLID